MKEFISIIASLDLKEAVKSRISLESIQLEALGPILGSSKGAEIIKKLAHAPELHQDIYAIASKKEALAEFQDMLDGVNSEAEWQDFFERNTWIFGLGLNYIFLDKVGDKLESVTTGSAFDRDGKRIDALMKTKAEVSQYVLTEIKKSATELV